MIRCLTFLFCLFWLSNSTMAQNGDYYPVTAVPFTSVIVTDKFWQVKIETNRTSTIPIAFKRSEETGRTNNFKVAGGILKGKHNGGRGFDDSDVFKVIDGASYSLQTHLDAALEKYLDSLIYFIDKAQEPDGYLYTVKTIIKDSSHRDSKLPKWVGDEDGSHELYNLGHLYEAAVAHFQATGKKTLLNIALESADLVNNVFGWGKLEMVLGHQEIEIGLVKLYTVTEEKKYLNLAKFFLDKRGQSKANTVYNQTHKKVINQNEAVGHSVRALYMYSAMADVAALTGDKSYMNASDKLWHDIVDTKLYIIEGVGAAGGSEGFGGKYELPNLKAYNETCAAVANVFWNERLFLTYADAKYIDVLELALYNNVISGVSLDGDKFFYPNRLASDGHSERSEWFKTSCCPSNIARILPSIPGYIYAYDKESIYLNLFISSKATINKSGNKIIVEQESNLPWDGDVSFIISPAIESSFNVKVVIKVNGKQINFTAEKGYAVINQKWRKGDNVTIYFPVEVREIISNENIKSNKGTVALQAGPIIYCTKRVDYKNGISSNLMLDDKQPLLLKYNALLLHGVMTIEGKASSFYENDENKMTDSQVLFKAIPYYAWANREQKDMEVWLPVFKEAVKPVKKPTIESLSKVTS